MVSIKEKLWNIELVINDIKKFPQTYCTILGDLVHDGTCQTILRRKLNKQQKYGKICKTNIPGTRFGKCIFYAFDKKYHIIVEANRIENQVYVFFEYKKISTFYIRLNKYWMLKNDKWKQFTKECIIFEGNVLRFI